MILRNPLVTARRVPTGEQGIEAKADFRAYWYMPGGLGSGCGFNLVDAASYFPCAAWLWAEEEVEEGQRILQPPTQNLAEALIPPTQPDISLSGTAESDTSHHGHLPSFISSLEAPSQL
jgi:hypothetical protein